MRAWTIIAKGEPLEVLEQQERILPLPDVGQLAVRVIASGLALPDVAMCRGTYSLTPDTPFTPGLDFVGTVIAAGPETSMQIGSKVMGVSAFHLGHGSLAQECLAREGAVYPVPEGMDDQVAAAFTIAYQTAYVGLVWRGRMCAGETVLVHGATGGTGAAAVQLAKAKGAKVIATAGSAEKVALCIAAGVDSLPLFATPAAPSGDELREKLASIDPDNITPREALDLLTDLKALAGQAGDVN